MTSGDDTADSYLSILGLDSKKGHSVCINANRQRLTSASWPRQCGKSTPLQLTEVLVLWMKWGLWVNMVWWDFELCYIEGNKFYDICYIFSSWLAITLFIFIFLQCLNWINFYQYRLYIFLKFKCSYKKLEKCISHYTFFVFSDL